MDAIRMKRIQAVIGVVVVTSSMYFLINYMYPAKDSDADEIVSSDEDNARDVDVTDTDAGEDASLGVIGSDTITESVADTETEEKGVNIHPERPSNPIAPISPEMKLKELETKLAATMQRQELLETKKLVVEEELAAAKDEVKEDHHGTHVHQNTFRHYILS